MTSTTDSDVNPPTPWEFLADDDNEAVPVLSGEEAAMHIDTSTPRAPQEHNTVVRYLDDEHPEVRDRSQRTRESDSTGQVDALLERQHYLPPDYD